MVKERISSRSFIYKMNLADSKGLSEFCKGCAKIYSEIDSWENGVEYYVFLVSKGRG